MRLIAVHLLNCPTVHWF